MTMNNLVGMLLPAQPKKTRRGLLKALWGYLWGSSTFLGPYIAGLAVIFVEGSLFAGIGLLILALRTEAHLFSHWLARKLANSALSMLDLNSLTPKVRKIDPEVDVKAN